MKVFLSTVLLVIGTLCLGALLQGNSVPVTTENMLLAVGAILGLEIGGALLV